MATVLVVDDSEPARTFLRMLLEYQNHDVMEAGDGDAGLTLARRLHPDLVITDILLPQVNGYDLARLIRGDPSMAGTRVLLTTAARMDGALLDLARRCGAMGVIPKPCEPEDVLGVIARTLAGPAPAPIAPLPEDAFGREQLEVLTNGLAETVDRLRAANEELARSEEGFRQLLALAPAAIVGVDHEGRIKVVNALAEAAFGYTREELLGEPIEVLVPESLRGPHVRDRAIYLESPTVRPMGVGRELEGLRRDGSHFPVTVSLSTVEAGNELIVLAAVTDISERVRQEQERARLEATLARAQRLESVGQLAGGIAHDFNNLLAVIMNYATFVHRVVDPDVQEDVEQIRLAAKRAADLVRQLLLFSRGQVASPDRLYVHDVLTDLRSLLDRSIGEQVTLRLDMAAAVPPVLVDRSKLEQVIVNLVVNARDAMPKGGPIDIEMRLVEFGSGQEAPAGLTHGRYVRLEVRDAGVGMPQPVMDQVFDPFFTTKPRGQGTGLGLATVYGIVTEAGGIVTVSSELGAGTQMAVYLPAIPDFDRLVAADEDGPVLLGDGELVLVVEDESSVLEVATRILERSHYRVVKTHNPNEALALAAALDGPPDLLLSDVVMPGLSGPDLIGHFRARWPGIPALLMSGYTGDANSEPLAGVGLLAKPFTDTELLAGVRAALEGRA